MIFQVDKHKMYLKNNGILVCIISFYLRVKCEITILSQQ